MLACEQITLKVTDHRRSALRTGLAGSDNPIYVNQARHDRTGLTPMPINGRLLVVIREGGRTDRAGMRKALAVRWDGYPPPRGTSGYPVPEAGTISHLTALFGIRVQIHCLPLSLLPVPHHFCVTLSHSRVASHHAPPKNPVTAACAVMENRPGDVPFCVS